MKHSVGLFLVFILSVVTFVLWLISKDNIFLIIDNLPRSISQISGLLGVVWLSLVFFLSSRLRVIEQMFGGMEKMYRTHQIMGAFAFVLIINHPLWLIISVLPRVSAPFVYVFPGAITALNYGIYAIYSLIVLIILAVFIKLPYHIWHKIHVLMIIPLAFAFLHIITITSDISNYLPLRIWTIGFFSLAVSAWIYKRLIYTKFSRQYKYHIDKVIKTSNLVDVYLKPIGKKNLKFQPCQFVFVRFYNRFVGSQKHPFSIASSPDKDYLRLSIKKVGDFTVKLQKLQVGDSVTVYGPHGILGQRFLSTPNDLILIAGGIGITPFLSMIGYELANNSTRRIWFYHSIKNEKDNYFDGYIKRILKNNSFILYKQHFSNFQGYLNAGQIAKEVENLQNKTIFLCAPPLMMSSLKKQFIKLGVKSKNIVFEDFSFVP